MNNNITKPKSKWWAVILWWELRRVPLNIILITTTFIALKLIGLSLADMEMGSGEYFVFIAFVSIILFINIIHTIGWIVELIAKPEKTFATKYFIWSNVVGVFLVTFLTLYLI